VVLSEGSNLIQVNIQNATYRNHSLSIGIQRDGALATSAVFQARGQVSQYRNFAIRFRPL
jgi:hypothetical protein